MKLLPFAFLLISSLAPGNGQSMGIFDIITSNNTNFAEGKVEGETCLQSMLGSVCLDYSVSACEDTKSVELKILAGGTCDSHCAGGQNIFDQAWDSKTPINLADINIPGSDQFPEEVKAVIETIESLGLTIKIRGDSLVLPGYANICMRMEYIVPVINTRGVADLPCVEVGSDCTALSSREACSRAQYCGWCSTTKECLHSFGDDPPLCAECAAAAYTSHDALKEMVQQEKKAAEEKAKAAAAAAEEQEHNEKHAGRMTIAVLIVVLVVVGIIAAAVWYFKCRAPKNSGYNPAGADMGAGGAAGNGGITSDSDDFSDINAPSDTGAPNYHHPVYVTSLPPTHTGGEEGLPKEGASTTV